MMRITETNHFRLKLNTYVFLRDYYLADFASVERLGYLFQKSNQSLPTAATPSPGAATQSCGWCHKAGIHRGGKQSCPFKGLNFSKARAAGAKTVHLISDGTPLVDAIAQALSEQSTTPTAAET
jgi:hypothetical protein